MRLGEQSAEVLGVTCPRRQVCLCRAKASTIEEQGLPAEDQETGTIYKLLPEAFVHCNGSGYHRTYRACISNEINMATLSCIGDQCTLKVLQCQVRAVFPDVVLSETAS
eukprot:5409385-Amphidinium_carterae.1